MRIKTICSLQTRKAMACARNRANRSWMKSSTCRTAHMWKNMIRGSWLDVLLFSHVGKAIRDIWLVYIGLRTKIYSAAFQSVNLSTFIIIYISSYHTPHFSYMNFHMFTCIFLFFLNQVSYLCACPLHDLIDQIQDERGFKSKNCDQLVRKPQFPLSTIMRVSTLESILILNVCILKELEGWF